MRRDPIILLGMALGGLCLLGLIILGIILVRCPRGRCQTTAAITPLPTPTQQPAEPETPDSRAELSDRLYVDSPRPDAAIASPLVVTGAARGTWYFEASFPVRLLDGAGKELAVKPAQAQGEWMTTEYVPFLARLEFTPPATATGTLVLEKDNPSGLPEHAAELRIPVRFR